MDIVNALTSLPDMPTAKGQGATNALDHTFKWFFGTYVFGIPNLTIQVIDMYFSQFGIFFQLWLMLPLISLWVYFFPPEVTSVMTTNWLDYMPIRSWAYTATLPYIFPLYIVNLIDNPWGDKTQYWWILLAYWATLIPNIPGSIVAVVFFPIGIFCWFWSIMLRSFQWSIVEWLGYFPTKAW